MSRTPRTQVINSFLVESLFNGEEDRFERADAYEDLTIPGFVDRVRETLQLTHVRDGTTAATVGRFALGWRKRQRLVVTLETLWNAVQLQLGDAFTVAGHPLLARHGGDGLVFRVVALRWLFPGPARVAVVGVEARVPPEWWAWWQTQPSPVPTWKVALGL